MSGNDRFLHDMLKKLMDLETEVKRLSAAKPLFQIANVSANIPLSTNQDNYDASIYDTLYITTTGTVTISGFAGGVRGRKLYVHNVGGTLQLLHASGASIATNQIFTQNALTLSIATRNTALLEYFVVPTGFWRVLLSS